MAFSINEQDNVAIIQIKGKFLGSIEGPAFKEGIEALKDKGQTQVVIDLSPADFMDSTGIGVLISSLTTMRKADGDVRLAGMEKRIKNLFLLTRLLGPVFEGYDTVNDAVKSYKTNPSPTGS